MRIAFYAPLKPPSWPVPSGDRLIARTFMAALQRAGHDIELASVLRTYDGGDRQRQTRLREIGTTVAGCIMARFQERPKCERPELWFTYHLYHKAPDWIGPAVASALAIPYVVAEASYAPKQAGGRWDEGHGGVASALGRADLVISINSSDREGVRPLLEEGAKERYLAPFIDCTPFTAAAREAGVHRRRIAEASMVEPDVPWLLAAAMMRPGNKRASFELLAGALTRLVEDHGERNWHVFIAGDGTERAAIEAAFARHAGRVTWLGLVERSELASFYAVADLFVWPAIDEPLGMCFIEAQAAGTPVVAGRARGVGDLIADGASGLLCDPGDERAFTAALADLLGDPERRRAMGRAAMAHAIEHHDLAAAAKRLGRLLEEVRP